MEFLHHTLPNGIRLVHKPTPNGQTAHFGLTVNAGSRDEEDDEQGLAHFIEHCLFKGTKRRKAFHILSRMDSVGAELNAYTTKEETVIYASFLLNHFERAIEVIADIAKNSTFPEKEIAKERDVIIDEIQSYQDNPAELIFDDFEELIYGGHPIGRNILGTEESVKQLGRDQIHSFIKRRYKSSEIVLSAVGNISFKKLVKWADKHFGDIPTSAKPAKREPVKGVTITRKRMELDTFQAHLIMGGIAYPNNHDLNTAAVLMNNYLGGPAMNSRLNMNIREKHGIAYNIESAFQPYSDTGLISIYLGTDKKLMERSEKLVHRELTQLREKRLTTTALHRAKQQLKGQLALSQEGGASLMQALGKSMIIKDKVSSMKEVLDRIDSVTDSDVLEVANHCFDRENLCVLIYE
ncbi:MAG: M16 family metallopeptidase [Cryomorphaceae bacterium]